MDPHQPDLDILANDLMAEAINLLGKTDPRDKILGIELDRADPRISVLVAHDDRSPPRAIYRVPASNDEGLAEVVALAKELVTAWINAMPEDARIKIGYGVEHGSHMAAGHFRIYARPSTSEIALAAARGGMVIELAHRYVVAPPPTIQ